jgi:uncharacterized protein (TIGR02145 family)
MFNRTKSIILYVLISTLLLGGGAALFLFDVPQLLASIGKDINAYDVQVGGDGTVYANINKQRVSASLPSDEWSEVQLVYDGSTQKLYVNGVQQSIAALSGAVTANDNSFHISTFGRATIDEVKLYNYARTPAQVAFDYNGGKPIAHWKFDEGQGRTLGDSSGHGTNGTVVFDTNSTGWSAGKVNGAFDFDGTDDYISIGSVGTTSAISFWVYADNNSRDIMDFDGGTHSIEVSGGTISATGFATPTIYVNGMRNATNITTGAWYHVAITTATAFNASTVKFGKETTYFDGKLDDVRFYNYERTAEQVAQDYNNGAAIAFGNKSGNAGLSLALACGTDTVADIEGNIYSTVKIGSQCWLAENMRTTKYPDGLNITKGPSTHGGGGWDTDQGYYSCPPNAANNAEDCAAAESLGMLYQWSAVMNGSASCNGTGESQPACTTPVQGICPTGWHIPSHYEWTALERAVCTSGTCATDFLYDETANGYKGTDEGSRLAGNVADQNWAKHILTGEADFGTSGFNLPASGYRHTNSNYYSRAYYAYVWSSLESDGGAWLRFLDTAHATVFRDMYYIADGFSVRCLQD